MKAGWRFWLGAAVLIAVILISAIWVAYPKSTHAANLKQVRSERLEPLRRDLTRQGMTMGQPVLIRIFKETSELELWVKAPGRYRLYKTFRICNWSGDLGPKTKEGDGQSPEGFYKVSRAQMKPDSQYHLAFNLGYPNAYDRANGRTGSFLMVHGNCVSIGCYAMTDKGIEDIWLIADEALKGGQAAFQVQIYPFRMTETNLSRHQGSPWNGFWRTLKSGYDSFEKNGQELNVSVTNKAYVITNP